jgi:pimeloyl-ACP methyl ester carboxylesterase
VNDVQAGLPPAPWASQLIADSAGYVHLPDEVVLRDFAQDLPTAKARIVAATQGPIAAKAFGDRVTHAAWQEKPSWYVLAQDDRMIDPQLQKRMAEKIEARITEVKASHVPMLSRPDEVTKVILDACGKGC